MSLESSSVLDAVLRTKLFVPATPPDLVPRPRLINRLNDSLRGEHGFVRRLTLIAAPAGYGKTTLVAEWLAAADPSVSWLSLDADDNDPARFLTYLAASLQRNCPELESSLTGMLEAAQRPPDEVALTALINTLSGSPIPIIFAIDDYHTIQHPGIHQQLRFLVEHLPPQLHMVIMAREDPPLPLVRLQARGQLLALRERDLQFTAGEAAVFFQRLSDSGLTRSDIASLNRRTEGWVTGLKLAALSMGGAEDLHGFVRSFTGSNRFILDYLFEEVFLRQPEQLQGFLLKTSILERFTGELCDAVTESEDGQATIEALEHANLFIVPLDQARRWYRYHRLFVDLLRHRLRLSPTITEPRQHRLASEWFEAHGYMEEAIQHALAAQDWERAAALILDMSESMLRRGLLATLLRWFQALPEELFASRPDLELGYGWCLILLSHFEQAESHLRRAEDAAGDDGPLLGEIAAAQAYVARTVGDVPRTVDRSEMALELLPAEDRPARGIVALNLGIIYWHAGRLVEAERLLQGAVPDLLAAENAFAAQAAQIFLGRCHASRGRLQSAELQFLAALESAPEIPTSSLAHHDLGALHYEWGQWSQAKEHLDQALEIAKTTKSLEFQLAAYIQLARIHLGLGALEEASDCLQASDSLAEETDIPPPTLARRAACQAQLALAQGDLNSARRWSEAAGRDHDAHPFNRFLGLNQARLQLAEGNRAAAAELLNQAHRKAISSQWGYAALVVRVLQCLTADSADTALDFLRDALQRAESQGFIRIFLDEGEAILPHLREAERRRVAPGYVREILAVYERQRGKGLSKAQPREQPIAEPLTERELEVLQLVAAGLSNRQIAGQLVVSLGTVKSHIHHIFGKLDVRSRTQAVSRARELNLI